MFKALILLLFPALALGQAVDTTFKLPSIGGVRTTSPTSGQTFTPYWVDLDGETVITELAQTLTDDVAYTLNLVPLCKVDDEASGAITFAAQSGTYPTGVSFSTNQITGTPTTQQTTEAVVRCTFTPDVGSPTTADLTIDFTVDSPTDETAPSVPQNLVVTALSPTSVQVSWSASTDTSGILSYDVQRRFDLAACQSGDGGVITTVTATTLLVEGLTAEQDYAFKVLARDNSPAQNVSAYSSCVEIVMPAEGGGGSGTTLIVDEGFESFTVGDIKAQLPTATLEAITNGTGTMEVTTDHAREGTKSYRSRILKSGTSNYRQEIQYKTAINNADCSTNLDRWWHGWSIYVESTSSLVSQRVIQQIHTIGQTGVSPTVGVRIDNGNWRIKREVGDADQVTIGPVATDEWTDFVLEIEPASDNTGLVRLWKNGALVYEKLNDETCFTGVPSEPGNNLFGKNRNGDYSSSWRQSGNGDANGTEHEHFHDAVRTCWDDACTYEDVAPQGDRLSAD